MVEPEAFQAGGDLVHDVAAREPDGVRPRPHAATNLGGDDDILALDAKVAQGLADLNLGLALGIDIGGVNEIDAGLERPGDKLCGGGLIERPDGAPETGAAAEGHGPKADFGNKLAGAAKRSIAHETSVPCGGRRVERRGEPPIQPRASRSCKSLFRERRREARRVRPPRLQPAAPWRRSSSRPHRTSSPSSGRQPSSAGPGGGCESDRRPRTHAAYYAK